MAVVLVTGAAGFIGSHLAERLLDRGDAVVGLDNFDAYYSSAIKEQNLRRALAHPNYRFVDADLRSERGIVSMMAHYQPDRVVHLAAKSGLSASVLDPGPYVETNFQGTLNLLRGCERTCPEHLVFASSSSVYGNAPKLPCSEADPSDDPTSPYAATKKAGELLCQTYHHLLNLPVTCVRLFAVYGPRQRPDLAISRFARLILSGEPVPFYGDGASARDYTYVDDVVDGIIAALDRPSGLRTLNLGAGQPVSLQEMVRTLERVLGREAVLHRMPEPPGDIHTTYADITRAKAQIGYQPRVDFDEGLRRFVAWYLESFERGWSDSVPLQTAASLRR